MTEEELTLVQDESFPRLRRAFRFGILHGPSGSFIPLVTIGLAKDGGLFAAPVEIPGISWSHGPMRTYGSLLNQPNISTNDERPKLHYHRSGIVRASLTGTQIETATSQFTPLHERGVNTFLCVTVVRPGELPTKEFRRGDVSTVEGRWPAVSRLSFSIIPPSSRTTSIAEVGELAPMGLVSETPSQFVVALSGYGHELMVLGQITSGDEMPPGEGTAITVVAYPEPREGETGMPMAAHALWSEAANPLLGYDDDFLWEAKRHSPGYLGQYVRRFNRLPPWNRLSGTKLEPWAVLAVHVGTRVYRRLRPRRDSAYSYYREPEQ
jgi:hypothetical protein